MSFLGEYLVERNSKSYIYGFSFDSGLKVGTEIDIYINSKKYKFSAFFDKLSSSVLWESTFDANFLIMVFNGKIFRVVHHFVNPRVL